MVKVKDEEHMQIKAFIAATVNNVARYCYAHDNPDPDDARTGWRTVKDWIKLVDLNYDEEIRGIKPTPPEQPPETKGIIGTVVGAPKVILEDSLDKVRKVGSTVKEGLKLLFGIKSEQESEKASEG
jgi:hypothetical protein